MWRTWIIGLLGLWLLLSTVIELGDNQLAWSTGVTGGVIAILAFSKPRV